MAVIKYKIFPYKQLLFIKNIVDKPQIHTDYFHHKVSFFQQHGRRSYDIVFIGDSITDGAEWSDLFPSVTIANRGIGGDRTDGVLKRMDSIYSTNAKKVFIMIGANDFSSGYEIKDVIKNYKTIVNKLIAHKMHVYIQSTILTGKEKSTLNIKILALNNALKKIARENKSVTYIDINKGLTKNLLLNPTYSRDGIHLNGDGYAIWKNSIQDYIR